MRKITLLLTLCLMCVGLSTRAQISSTADLNNSTTYTVQSQGRGFYYYDASKSTTTLTSSSHTTLTNVAPTGEVNEQFAFLRTNSTAAGEYYMYSIGAGKFVVDSSSDVALHLSDTPSTTVSFKASGTYFVLSIATGNKVGQQLNITNWQAVNGCKIIGTGDDEGNKMTVKAVNTSADLSAAIAKIEELEGGDEGEGEGEGTPADYNVNFQDDNNTNANNRYIKNVSVNGEKVFDVDNTSKKIYYDKTAEKTFTVEAGSNINVILDFNGSWMNKYVYIDEGNDGLDISGVGIAGDGYTPTGDLKSYSFYDADSNESGYNSLGNVVSGNARGDANQQPPTFKAPINPGTYRMRFKIDWNSIDPRGCDITGNTIKQNGGAIVDVMLTVTAAPEGVEESVMNELISSVEAILALDGVGYPVDTERTTLQEAINAAKADKTSNDLYNALSAARTAYIATSNVKLPEDGKAYIFKNVMHTGAESYFAYAESGIYITSDLANATPFVAKKVGNKFMFVNNAGKYMVWKGGKEGYNSNKGYIDAYDNTTTYRWSDLTLSKLVPGEYATGSQDDMFGYLTIKGWRNASTAVENYIVVKNASGYDHAAAAFFKNLNGNNFSSAFKFIEVEYENTPELKAADGIDGVEGLATFSAPFATVLPEGVTAWYVEGDVQSSTAYMKMTALEGAVPANTGVILTGAIGEVTMVPAAAEAVATVNNNWLKHSAGADLDVPAEESAFILGKANGVVGFYRLSDSERTLGMNKAYLSNDVLNSASQVVKMNFDGETTAIETVEKVGNVNAPIYDLSGRRVVNAVKGGLYIQNGKKFIVK